MLRGVYSGSKVSSSEDACRVREEKMIKNKHKFAEEGCGTEPHRKGGWRLWRRIRGERD